MAHDDRVRIDPDGRYPADGLRRVEQSAMRVLTHLPGGRLERTRDAIQIDQGGENGIVVLVTAEAVEFRLPTVEWTRGAYGPAQASRLWKRVKTERLSDELLESLIRQALDTRAREFRKCKYCREVFPSERRHGNVCHGCAVAHLGVVH